MAESATLDLRDADDTQASGARLARAFLSAAPVRFAVYLRGELGAGKTTLVRGFLSALGHSGRVPSPTYTLIEPYSLAGYAVYHIDLYRIRSAGELLDLGLGELLEDGAVALIEWPQHGDGELPPADITVDMALQLPGRRMTLQAGSAVGVAVMGRMMTALSEPGPRNEGPS